MEDKFTYFLNPENFKIDDRNLDDLILFVKNLSKHYRYFDLKNKSNGDWFDLFASDESLLADISKLEILKYDALRLSLTQSFDELSSEKEKKKLQYFFGVLFQIINDWYDQPPEIIFLLKALKSNWQLNKLFKKR